MGQARRYLGHTIWVVFCLGLSCSDPETPPAPDPTPDPSVFNPPTRTAMGVTPTNNPDPDCTYFEQMTAGTPRNPSQPIFEAISPEPYRSVVSETTILQIPWNFGDDEVECTADQTATPVIICDHLVFPMHFKRGQALSACARNNNALDVKGRLYAISLADSTLRIVDGAFDSESSVAFARFDHDEDGVKSPFLVTQRINISVRAPGPATISWFNLSDGSVLHQNPTSNVVSDSAGLWDVTRDQYVFGNVNNPQPMTNGCPPNKNAGGIFAITPSSGDDPLVQLTADERLRGWIVGSPTSNGERLFVGLGAGTHGSSCRLRDDYTCDVGFADPDECAEENREYVPMLDAQNTGHACAAVSLPIDLQSVVEGENSPIGYDPGDVGCVGFPIDSDGDGEADGQEQGATTAELPIDTCRENVWVQFRGPNNTTPGVPDTVVLAKLDMNADDWGTAECALRLAKNGERDESGTVVPSGSASFYQSPVIDAQGNAWFTHAYRPVEGAAQAQLWRVGESDCEGTLFELTSDGGPVTTISAPTLAVDADGDTLVYVAYSGGLYEFEIDPDTGAQKGAVTTYVLHDAKSISAPVLDPERGNIVVVSVDGAVSIVRNTKAVSYGDHVWPRMRRDNAGSATNMDDCR